MMMAKWDNEFGTSQEESDLFIESLLENVELLDQFDESSLEIGTDNQNCSSFSEHHVITVSLKRRRYNRTKDKNSEDNTITPFSKTPRVVLPRIIKSDIRRKYSLMYQNVMNSYDYHLIYSFFHQFMDGNVHLESQLLSKYNQPIFRVMLQGVTVVSGYFLSLLQLAPDKVTRVSDIQLKQSSTDLETTEITCNFFSKNTRIYEAHPNLLTEMLQDERILMIPSEEEDQSLTQLVKKKKRKANHQGLMEQSTFHKELFDPINGTFIKSRFNRIENPLGYAIEGKLSFIVNHQKRIKKILVSIHSKLPQAPKFSSN